MIHHLDMAVRSLHTVTDMHRVQPVAVRFDDVWCEAPRSPSLRALSFVLARGEAMVLVGSPVAGASLVIDLLLGRTRPSRGRIEVLGRDPAEVGRLIAFEVGVGRRPDGMLETLSVLETLRYAAALYRLYCPPKYLSNLIERVHLGGLGVLPVARLAPFERRRLVLARALIHNPIVIALEGFLDDLDEGERELTESILSGFVNDGKAIFITSDAAARAGSLAARVSLLTTV